MNCHLPVRHPETTPAVIPPLPALEPGAVDALTVRSYGSCGTGGGGALVWDEINSESQELGDRQVRIDHRYGPACDGPTYEMLVERGADVLILSNTAGALNQLEDAEIDAIERYVADGHGPIATFLLKHSDIDNSALGPTLGVDTRLALELVPADQRSGSPRPDAGTRKAPRRAGRHSGGVPATYAHPR